METAHSPAHIICHAYVRGKKKRREREKVCTWPETCAERRSSAGKAAETLQLAGTDTQSRNAFKAVKRGERRGEEEKRGERREGGLKRGNESGGGDSSGSNLHMYDHKRE